MNGNANSCVLRASIHAMFRQKRRGIVRAAGVGTMLACPPKAEATGSNPVGCTINQQLRDYKSGFRPNRSRYRSRYGISLPVCSASVLPTPPLAARVS